METQKWLDAQITEAQQLITQGNQFLRQGNVSQAASALEQASAIIDMADVQSDELLKLKARMLNEYGVVFQRQKNVQRAVKMHQQAVDICEELTSRGVDFQGNSAASYLNLSSILMMIGKPKEAQEAADKAIDIVEGLTGDDLQNVAGLAMGVYQNRSIISARTKGFDDARANMLKSLDVLETIEDESQKARFSIQAAQGCQQLSVVFFEVKQFDFALEWGLKAEAFAEKIYEKFGQQVLSIYVISEINLISYHEKLGNFADAEDCLWKALDVVGNDQQLLHRGLAFYENCRKQADSRLDAGNLPREEVEQGLADLHEKIDAAGGLKPLNPPKNA